MNDNYYAQNVVNDKGIIQNLYRSTLITICRFI